MLSHAVFVLGVPDDTFPKWSVELSVAVDKYDLALLRLRPLDDRAEKCEPRAVTLRLAGPDSGELVTVYGYADQRIEGDLERMSYFSNERVEPGRVLDVYKLGRDATFTSPGFSCSADFAFGMSGGAVVDSLGRICGIVSHAMSGETPMSYAACLWPACMLAVPNDPDETVFREAVKMGWFKAEDVERIFLVKVEGDSRVQDVIIDPNEEGQVDEYVHRVWKGRGLEN